ncbi:MAG: sigma 54-interacting transcriptional regulator [Thermoanaerobacteraceae bacterium]|nr:sigma 54-interacting transcriptional regulator [Thermoanaerobacteraceae bacterium]
MAKQGKRPAHKGIEHGIILVDREGIITSCDEQASHLLKIPPVKAVGLRLTEVIPATRVLEVLTTGNPVGSEHVLADGTAVVADYLPLVAGGQLNGVVVCLHKLVKPAGERELETLRVLTELYEGILADLPLGMAVVNRQGRLVMVNKHYCRLLGIKEGDVLGLPVEEVVPFTRLGEVLGSGQPLFNTGVSYNGKNLFLSEVPIKQGREILGGLSKLMARESLEEKDWQDLWDRFQILESKLMFYKEELKQLKRARSPFDVIIGENAEMKKLKQLARRVATGDASVLITGESGTGKELFAHAIHNASPRNGEPFIKINCAAIPDNLLESELFGYEEGAFTGASRGGKPGKFELASGGTIFLDEIGDMPLAMQAKILRVLQEKSFERLGGTRTINVDVRVIAATNRDLKKLVEEKQFRLDLYYRLAVINLHIPPLRQRRDDILLLAKEIIRKLSIKYAHQVEGLDPGVEELFLAYSWPGNVRELENVLEHAFNFLEPGETHIQLAHLPELLPDGDGGAKGLALSEAVARAEIEAIRQALNLAGGNKQQAARILGIHPSGLYQKLKKYAIGDD